MTTPFVPTEVMYRTKAAYWVRRKEFASTDTNEPVTLAAAIQVTGDSRLGVWWKEEGFKEWFGESDTMKIEMEALAMQLPRLLTELLADASEKTASARLNAMKLIAEVAEKMPAKLKEIKFADGIVSKMDDPKQLKEFINRNMKKLEAAK